MGAVAIFIIIISALLTLVVLIQNSKGGGIASNFASNTQVMGVKKQAEYIEKVTWVLIISLMLLCIGAGVGNKGGSDKDNTDSVVKEGEVKTTQPPSGFVAPGSSNTVAPPPAGGGPTGQTKPPF